MGIDPVTHAPRLINVQELYSFLNSPRQLNIQNLFQIDSEMNTNLLNVVTSLALPRCKNPPNYQQILHNNQLSNLQLIQNQIETLQSNNLHNSATPLSDTLLMQAEMEQFTPNLATNNRDNSALGQNLVSPQELGHYGFGSVISTPSSISSHLNSSTMYVNGSGHEDEKDTYCSNMMLFDMPYSASFGF
ncbi:hypothetical protein LguiA_023185 [Lonicera macranthoides]